MYICTKSSGTYPCALLNKRFLQEYLKNPRESYTCSGPVFHKPNDELLSCLLLFPCFVNIQNGARKFAGKVSPPVLNS